jgi:branched-chain amino acid aminotransferase
MSSYAYFQKQFMPLEDASVGVMTHALHYGTGVFEGIRGNWNADKQQMYIFRLAEHFERLHNGCKVLRINLDKTVSELCELTLDMVRKCGFKEDIYIRPLAYKSSQALGVRLHDLEDDFLMFCFPWGPYLDVETARVGVSSWRRPADNSIPPQVKSTGIYISSAQCKTEAQEHGYDEGIMLAPDGYVSEGSGENIFLVQHGKLVTPGVYSSILEGITRNSVIEVAAKELGIETEQRLVMRAELYTSDECFLTGTAANLTPVSEVDGRKVGENGGVGEITKKLQELYFKIVKGDHPDYMDWCTPVY